MTDTVLKVLYILNKVFVVIAGTYITFRPPFTWIGSVSGAIMIVAGLICIYAIWSTKYAVEFVSLWFVSAGVAAYTGFMWQAVGNGEDHLVRATVASMALVMLVARGIILWRLVYDLNKIERGLENND